MPHKIRPRSGIYFSAAVLKKYSFGIIVQKKVDFEKNSRRQKSMQNFPVEKIVK